MPVASVAQFTANLGIPEVFAPGMVSVVYKNNFVGMWPQLPAPVGDLYMFKAHLAANTSAEIYTEGAATPTPVSQTYANASLAYIYGRALTRITGHLRDALAGMGPEMQFNVIDQEFTLGAEDVNDIFSTTWLGANSNGIALAVDSAGTYANISRTTYSQWGSYEAAVGGALTYASLADGREAIRDNERGGRVNVILAPENQVTNIQTLAGTPGQANNSYRTMFEGGQLQLAPNEQGTMFGSAVVVGVGDLTDTEIYLLDTTANGGIRIFIRRGITVRKDAGLEDDTYAISMAGTIVFPNPRRQGKLTGVTA